MSRPAARGRSVALFAGVGECLGVAAVTMNMQEGGVIVRPHDPAGA